jgi:hypothetical protein
VAMRALPEKLGAPVPAAHADVRVEIEDGLRACAARSVRPGPSADPSLTTRSRWPGESPARAGCARALRGGARTLLTGVPGRRGASRAPRGPATRAVIRDQPPAQTR